METNSFGKRAKAFILSACRSRLFLLETNKSKISDPNIYNTTKGIINDVDPLSSDMQLADFICQNEDKIIRLVPKNQCKGIQKRIDQFNKLLETSKQLMS